MTPVTFTVRPRRPGKHTDAAILRGLLTNRPGSKEWRKWYAAYRRTAHWKRISHAKLEDSRHCQMCYLMSRENVSAQEVHHAAYAWFHEALWFDLVSVCKKCHQLWTNRFGKRR